MTTQYNKPLPRPYNAEVSRPYWEAAKRHELVLQRCKPCGHWVWYPREICPFCLSQDLDWAPVSGKGRLYSYTIVYQPASRAFNEDVPYINCTIMLDEGVRINSMLVDHEPIGEVVPPVPADVVIDMPVEVVFDDVTPEWTLPKFKPVREG